MIQTSWIVYQLGWFCTQMVSTKLNDILRVRRPELKYIQTWSIQEHNDALSGLASFYSFCLAILRELVLLSCCLLPSRIQNHSHSQEINRGRKGQTSSLDLFLRIKTKTFPESFPSRSSLVWHWLKLCPISNRKPKRGMERGVPVISVGN